MPTYEYECSTCRHRFEIVQKITEPPLTTCPKCGAEKIKRLVSAPAFHLKGSGWYKTDYSSSKRGDAGESKKGDSSKTESEDTSSPTKSEEKSASTTSASSAGESQGTKSVGTKDSDSE